MEPHADNKGSPPEQVPADRLGEVIMIPGIDPKVDIAFRKLFGTEAWRNLTVSLINAVLQPGPLQPLMELELLNPYSEKMALDDKLSILDIKARDEQGRLFNVEMQMVAGASLAERFLYYWAKLYTQQLAVGEDYRCLRPTISICFVNGTLFPGREGYHRRFELFDTHHRLALTGDLALHVIEISNFERELGNLTNPLDLWLYFFKNGIELDADALPEPLDIWEIRQAMEVLKMLSRSDLEREIYEGRLKAERDRLTEERFYREAKRRHEETERHLKEAEQRMAETEQRYEETEQRMAETEQRMAEIEQCRVEAEQRLGGITHERDQVVRDASKLALVGQIQLCERLLGRPVTDSTELQQRDERALCELASRLERELTPPQ